MWKGKERELGGMDALSLDASYPRPIHNAIPKWTHEHDRSYALGPSEFQASLTTRITLVPFPAVNRCSLPVTEAGAWARPRRVAAREFPSYRPACRS